MNFWGYFFVAAAAVFVFSIQHANGLDLSLCLENVINNECQSSRDHFGLSRTDSNNKNKNATDSKLVLKDGFRKFNSTVAAAEDKAMGGLSASSRLVDTQPQVAAQTAKQAMKDAQDTILDAGAILYVSLAEAANVSRNSGARQGLAEANQKVQLVEIELLDQLRAVSSLADQVFSNGGNPAREAIEVARQALKAGFAALYFEGNVSYHQANISVSNAQLRCGPSQIKDTNANDDAASDNIDAQEAISEINKAADGAIKRGAPASKVNPLRKSLIDSLKDFAQVAAHVRDYFTVTTQLAIIDPESAKNIYLKEAQDVCKRIQEIFANVCMDIGAAAVKSSESTKMQIRDAIKSVERGNDQTVIGNKIAKYYTLFAFSFKGNVQKLAFKSAAQSGNFAEISSISKVVEGGKAAFEALTN